MLPAVLQHEQDVHLVSTTGSFFNARTHRKRQRSPLPEQRLEVEVESLALPLRSRVHTWCCGCFMCRPPRV